MANPPRKIRWTIFIVLALLALAARLPQLGERPMHTDESINGYIIGQLLEGKAFHYDPRDRHGPALAAFTLPLVKLEGARDFSTLTESELRLGPVLAGAATVLLFGAGVEMFGFITCVIAALLFTLAPLPFYYNRYFIHESLFVAATLGLILSGWRSFQSKSVLMAAMAGFCAGLMLAAKETAPLHFSAMVVAVLGCWMLNSHKKPIADFLTVKVVFTGLGVCLFTVVVLFTWFGRNLGVFADLWQAVPHFVARAGGEGHEKPWWYYSKLLGDGWSGGLLDSLAILGFFLILFTRRGRRPSAADPSPADGALPDSPYRLFMAIYGPAVLVIYSAIPYKTPWLVLNFWPALALLAGVSIEWLWQGTVKALVRGAIFIFLLTLGGLMIHDTRERVFVAPADENNPYAYAHTVDDLLGLPLRIAALCGQKNWLQPRIAVVAADAWPLPWYLRKYSQVGYWQPGQTTGPADLYITTPEAAEAMGDQLKNFRPEFFGLRPEVLIILWTPAPPPKKL